MEISKRVEEIEEEIEGHRIGLGQHEDVIIVLEEMLLAVALSIPRDGASWSLGASRLDRVLEERVVTNRPLGSMATKLLQILRDDLRMLASGAEPSDPGSPSSPPLFLIRGSGDSKNSP